MKINPLGIFLCLMMVSLSFSGCLQPSPLPEAQNNSSTFDLPYYGISFQYPKEWTFISQERSDKADRMRESEDVKIIRARYTNNTSGFSFVLGSSRIDFDPNLYSQNFTGSQDCGYGWVDDRPNLIVLEAYKPVIIDNGQARKFLFILRDPENETVETYYEICRTYKSGKSMKYMVFWSAPSEKFYDYKPVVQEILDTIRVYEPTLEDTNPHQHFS